MSLQLRIGDRSWAEAGTELPPAARAQAARLLPIVAGVLLLGVDLALVVGAFMLAYWVRFIVPDAEAMALGQAEYLRMGAAVGLGTAVLFALQGLYDEQRALGWIGRGQVIISAVSTALVLAVTASFFLGDQRFSRLWFVAGWALAIVGLNVWRGLAWSLYTRARDALAPANRVLIVGANALGERLARELADRYQVVGYVDNGTDLTRTDTLPLLGPIAKLDPLVQAYGIDELVIALPAHRREQVSRTIARGFHRPVRVKFLADLGEVLPQRFEIQDLAGQPCIDFTPAARVSWLKRAMDVALASLVLLALAPGLVAIAILIKLDSPGPVIYRQQRVGKHGSRFAMYKFRSMRQDADKLLEALRAQNEATGPLFKIRQDPRITRVGRILRRLSLDELPQLFNVVKGEMSLVGPRPPLPAEVEKYEDWQLGRLRALPGITGLWQVSGRSEVPFHDMVRLDLHYIRNWSLGLDFEILVRTLPAVLLQRGAY
jgi:exopolysaccharide biosynthesis polyprenyl glycosylphosphotransferase